MHLSRDELVADWQSRLAAAELPAAGAAAAPAWLARVQQRLYRFLLSLYGGKQWRASDLAGREIEVHPDAGQTVVFDSPAALPLSGRPAKETGKIRAVLKSVAAAQGPPPAAGPLASLLADEPWVIVAALKPQANPDRYLQALVFQKIPVRVLHRRPGIALVVPAARHSAALSVVLEEERRALASSVAGASRIVTLVHCLTLGAVCGPLVGLALTALAGELARGPVTRELELLAFLGGWLFSIAVAGLAVLLPSSGTANRSS